MNQPQENNFWEHILLWVEKGKLQSKQIWKVDVLYIWFPYDRRRSRIADRRSQIADRRRSQRELFPYIRRRSETIAEPTVAYISDSGTVKITCALCSRENRSKQYGGRRGGNFAASKFISSFRQPILKFPWHCISPRSRRQRFQSLQIKWTSKQTVHSAFCKLPLSHDSRNSF